MSEHESGDDQEEEEPNQQQLLQPYGNLETEQPTEDDEGQMMENSDEIPDRLPRAINPWMRRRYARTGPAPVDATNPTLGRKEKFVHFRPGYRNGSPHRRGINLLGSTPNLSVIPGRNNIRDRMVSTPAANAAASMANFNETRLYEPYNYTDSVLHVADPSMTFQLANRLVAERMATSGLLDRVPTPDITVNSVVGETGEPVQLHVNTSRDGSPLPGPVFEPFTEHPRGIGPQRAREIHRQLIEPRNPEEYPPPEGNQTDPEQLLPQRYCKAYNYCNDLAETRTTELVGQVQDEKEINHNLEVEII